MTRQRILFALIGVAVLAALIGVWSLRQPFIDAAQADLKTRGFAWFEILGTRMPCHDAFDIGVNVLFRIGPDGAVIGGRLCRPFDRTSPWIWHPLPSRIDVGPTGK